MDLATFKTKQNEFSELLLPHKVLNMNEVHQVDGDLFRANDLDLVFDEYVIYKLSTELGLSQKQLKILKETSGTGTQASFLNYFLVAQGMKNDKKMVLLADPENKNIVDIIFPKKEFIPLEDFYQFVEFFVDATNSYIDNVVYSLQGRMHFVLYLKREKPIYRSIANKDSESFEINGLFLKWDGGRVSSGNYFVRQICSNGATINKEIDVNAIHSLSEEDWFNLIKNVNSNCFVNRGFEVYERKSRAAMETQASLNEVYNAYRFMKQILPEMDSQFWKEVVPYEDYEMFFKDEKAKNTRPFRRVITDIKMWDLYNNLTKFATHTDLLTKEDNVRDNILDFSGSLLFAKRDIANYIDFKNYNLKSCKN
ncbi:hypothetical protein EDM00_01345 [Ornithobacterium rhinotracheale]|uniref:hypothetical protein n=1 Tax=Ornithobacterium rhinotracheale TaxID=28251 RepID=UPI00129CE5C6|nr:hypothetical protein [Ornithobacterium rhinotracheale]MRI62646.1 hypothetical protein [Ornithobacterium rhinotracheale]